MSALCLPAPAGVASATLDSLRADHVRVTAAIDAAYWTFTRCARGKPVPGHLYIERNRIEDAFRTLVGHR